MNKPEWKDAPEWANYLAQDMNCCWRWYENEPMKVLGMGMWRAGGQVALAFIKDWHMSLEEKPKVQKHDIQSIDVECSECKGARVDEYGRTCDYCFGRGSNNVTVNQPNIQVDRRLIYSSNADMPFPYPALESRFKSLVKECKITKFDNFGRLGMRVEAVLADGKPFILSVGEKNEASLELVIYAMAYKIQEG